MADNSEIKEKLVGLAEQSTFHAIPNIVQTERTSIKLIWAVCLIISAGYCAKVLITNTVDYFRYEVETVIKIDRESQAEFPTVTLCFVQICAENGNTLYDLDTDLNSFKSDPNNADLFYSTRTVFESMKNFFKAKTYFNKTLKTILNQYNMTRSIKDYLISCQYHGDYCDENDFEYFQLGEFQRCFKFNSGRAKNNSKVEIRNARRYGKNNGLQLELITGDPNKCNLPLTTTSGLSLYVHNNTYTISEDTNGIQLAPGTETSVAIDRTLVSKLPDPYSNCVNEEMRSSSTFPTESIRRTFEITEDYTQQTCFQLCYQRYLVQYHKCYDESLPRTRQDIAMATGRCPKLIDIIVDQNKKLVNNSLFYETQDKQCLEECPTECDYVTYDMTMSNSEYPTQTYKAVLAAKMNVTTGLLAANDDLVRSSILAVNVFYRSDMFKSIKEKASIESEIFVSNIGGAIGLFLGISALSLVEIFETVFEVIAFFCFEKPRAAANQQIKVKPAMSNNQNNLDPGMDQSGGGVGGGGGRKLSVNWPDQNRMSLVT